MASKALSNYYGILGGGKRARYLDTKQNRVDVDLHADEGVLWEAHRHALLGGVGTTGDASMLDLKRELAHRLLGRCELCERRCKTDRTSGETGHCGVSGPHISSEFLHMGEEPDLIPSYTIFFSGCTFNCVFCQNWDISTRPGSGREIRPDELARMIEEKHRGVRGESHVLGRHARNVNWVGGDPTSNLPFILDVLEHCNANLPQVWNSNMYLTEESMQLLDVVIDVYLTDFKYGNDSCALRLSNARDYMRIVTRNHRLAREQAEVIVRHLVLPNHYECCTKPVLAWISENLQDVKVNVMSQYRPENKAREFEDIARPLRMSEFQAAIDLAESLGLELTD